MEDEPIENIIMFNITDEQAEKLANYYNVNIDTLEEYEICELLDRYIDELD